MLSIFRSNQFILNIFLIFYAVILHFSAFIVPAKPLDGAAGILSSVVLEALGSTSPIAIISSLLLVFVQATLINFAVSRYRMASTLSLFPGVFYILIASSLPEFLYLSPPLIANTFYIIAVLELFGVYKKFNSAREIFNAGFWIAVGSLFYFSLILYIILGLVALANLRSFKLKEALILIIGFTVPYIFVNVYYFLTDQWEMYWQQQVVSNLGFWDFSLVSSSDAYIKLGFFGLLIISAILNYTRYNFKKSIQVQKNISLLYWCMLIAALTLLLQSDVRSTHMLLLAMPLGIFLSFNFLKFNPPLAEALHFVLLALIILYQFRPLLGI